MRYRYGQLGRRRWLLTEPDTGAYGNTTLNMAMSFALGRHLGAAVCVRPVDTTRLEPLWRLVCNDVDVLPPDWTPPIVR